MIDIVIPVYDGYDETRKCIESVLKVENKIKYNIIIINDKSPNDKLSKYLKSLKDQRITLLENEQNLGFVKTVNKGMKLSNNDVILLNSDTIVTDRWIDKMYRASKVKENVATVTALTNNGAIVSVPNFNKDNLLPEGYSIDEFSSLIEKISKKKYPEIPTAVGHAMYINRKAIKKVGYFDDKNFGKGYGEENDFSMRCIKKGMINIVADDTYIFHFGATSFSANKKNHIENNKRILYKLHPSLRLRILWFIYSKNNIKQICNEIKKKINKNKQ
ncbi:glycosyltransferase family 2 protein [Clostridium perfringens]|uniref:glycosyltransferase family 2 protein n=1 Tax=Clostridium perfringens TaxID=1502 RepID=UPI0039E9B553